MSMYYILSFHNIIIKNMQVMHNMNLYSSLPHLIKLRALVWSKIEFSLEMGQKLWEQSLI